MHETIERLRREVCGEVADMSVEAAQVRPGVGRWSVQQIVEHLVLSYEATAGVAGVRVAKGTPTKASPTMPQRLGQFMIAGLGMFPKGRLAPAAVAPKEVSERGMDGGELGAVVGDALGRMDAALTAAEEMFGGRRRAVSHLVLGPMSVRQWRRFHLVHGRHHLKQIAAIRKGF